MTVKLDISESNFRPKEDLIETIRTARQEILQGFHKEQQAYARLEKSESHRIEAIQAKTLLDVGFQINAVDFNLTGDTITDAEKKIKEAKSHRKAALSVLEKIIAPATTRLQTAFQLLKLSESEFHIESKQELTDEFSKLTLVLNTLASQFSSIRKLREKYVILLTYLNNLKGYEKDEDLNLGILNVLEDSHDLMASTQKNLAGIAYPFDYAGAAIDLDKYLLEKLPLGEDFEPMYAALVDYLDKFTALYYRLLGRLAFISEKVEAKFGFEPLAVPEKNR